MKAGLGGLKCWVVSDASCSSVDKNALLPCWNPDGYICILPSSSDFGGEVLLGIIFSF